MLHKTKEKTIDVYLKLIGSLVKPIIYTPINAGEIF